MRISTYLGELVLCKVQNVIIRRFGKLINV